MSAAPGWVTVFRKELTDHARDRRSLRTALVGALIGPAFCAGLIVLLASWMNDQAPPRLLVAGGELAPSLIAFLVRAGADVQPAPAGYEQLIRDGDEAAALVVERDFPEDFSHGRPARVQLVSDRSNQKEMQTVVRLRQMLERYGQETGALRLVARGVDPRLAAAVAIDEVDLSTSQKRAAQILSMIPLFLMLAAFLGGMYAAIDALAGERERGSLEPLLLTPARRRDLVLGKWLAVLALGGATLLVTAGGFYLVLPRIPLEDLGVRAAFGLDQVGAILLAYLPLLCFSGALQLGLSTLARSFKEAQSYVQILMLAPTLPGLFLMLSPLRPAVWLSAVPFFGQELLATQIIRGEPVRWLSLALAAAGGAAATAACLAFTTRLLRDERIVFGR
ncbi:MAG: ABC transporter permease [Myxococcales bacterium]